MKSELSNLILKRIIDILASIFLILWLSPVYIIIAIIIKLEDFKNPLLFRQKVMGKNASHFTLIKFRTMVPHKIDFNLRKDNGSKKCEISSFILFLPLSSIF